MARVRVRVTVTVTVTVTVSLTLTLTLTLTVMSTDELLEAVASLQSIIDDEKVNLSDGLHLRLCNATQRVYDYAKALKRKESGADASESEDAEVEDEGEESEEEERERTEDDMGLNELAELWGWNFDFGRPGATLELEGLIWTIVEDTEAKRVCAAVRVLNGALKGSKPDDPADAERILEWKEELVAGRAIRVCSEILERIDDRGFENESHEEHWLYSIICDEILELFQRLGEGDALFRTKLRRNGALKGLKKYEGRSHLREAVLDMLKR